MRLGEFVVEKLVVSATYGGVSNTSEIASPLSYSPTALTKNPTASRCLNMMVDSAAAVKFKIQDGKLFSNPSNLLRPEKINELLNVRPNSYQDPDFFWRSLIMDLLTLGNAYIYHNTNQLFYLPADKMKVQGSQLRLVEYYEYQGSNGNERFEPRDIIHIKDNSTSSILVGESRFKGLIDIIDLHTKMKTFQKNFFNNNAMPGVVLMSPNTLTQKLKERKLAQWAQEFNPLSGARRPAFLDGGITLENLNTTTFKEMDFEVSIQTLENNIAKSMGVPPVLLDSGNNANISPNLRLFYLETIIPIVNKFSNALSTHFGYQIAPDMVGVSALQPDLRELANYVSSLVNGGVMTPNEGRYAVGLEAIDDQDLDKIRVPANIAGSASNPSQGGRPEEPDTGDE